MTTLAEAREAIYQRFVDVWNDETVYTFDNEDFKTPKRDPWVRLVVRHEGAFQETLGQVGNRRFARVGRVLVQVFTAEDQGTSRSDELVMLATSAFEGVTLASSTVRFSEVSFREVGAGDDKFFQALVDAPFEYDETK